MKTKHALLFSVLLLVFCAVLGVQSSLAMCGASQGYGKNAHCYTAGLCADVKGAPIVWCELQGCASVWGCWGGGLSKGCAVMSCLNPFNNNCIC